MIFTLLSIEKTRCSLISHSVITFALLPETSINKTSLNLTHFPKQGSLNSTLNNIETSLLKRTKQYCFKLILKDGGIYILVVYVLHFRMGQQFFKVTSCIKVDKFHAYSQYNSEVNLIKFHHVYELEISVKKYINTGCIACNI